MHRSIFLSIAVVSLLGTLANNATGQPRLPIPNQKITLQAAEEVLNTTIAMKDFQMPMKMTEFIGLVKSNVEAKGKRFPIHLDRNSFKMANPNEPPIGDRQVKFYQDVKIATVQNLVENACSQVPTENAVFEFVNGYFVITTGDPRKNAPVSKGALVDATQQVTAGEAMHFLNTTIDMRNYLVPMRVGYCLEILRERFAKENKKVPVFLDIMAFKKANPNDKWVYDEEVKFPANLKTVKMYDLLRIVCSQLPGKNAQFQYNNGYFYITPGKKENH